MQTQRAKNSQNTHEDDQEEGFGKLNIKTCYKAAVIETVWYWHKNRVQWNGLKRQETGLCVYKHMT